MYAIKEKHHEHDTQSYTRVKCARLWLGQKSAKVLLAADRHRRTPNLLKKVGHSASGAIYVLKGSVRAPGGTDSQKCLHFTKKRSSLHGRARFGCKSGASPGEGSNLLKSRRPLFMYVDYRTVASPPPSTTCERDPRRGPGAGVPEAERAE